MKKLLILFVGAFIALTAFGQESKSRYCSKYKGPVEGRRLSIEDHRSDTIDIQNTSIHLDFTDMSSGLIAGFTELSISAKMNAARIALDFEALEVDSVTGDGVDSYSYNDSSLIVQFAQLFQAGETLELKVHYHGSPIKDASGWGGFYFQSGFAWNLGVGFAADPHSYGRVWFPCFDNFIERSTFDFSITTPGDKYASCNGVLLAEELNGDGTKTYEWLLSQPIPSYLACVAIASYEVVESEINGTNGVIPVQLFARANDTNNLKASFTHLDEAVLAFEKGYGPYRFDKVGYSLVPFNAGAMEHATNITYPIYAANGGLSNESLMAHELAHMWWGDNTTCQTDGDMWLNEGWASFSEYLFEEEVYGRERYEKAMQEDLRFMLQFGHHFEEEYRPVSGQPHEYVYGDHVYKKGALVAHNLRAYLGDDDFFNGVAAFMENYQFSPVSSDSLEQFLTDYTGVDLSYFFRDWVYTGGYNVVVLDSFSSKKVGNEFQVKLHLQQKLKGTEVLHKGVPVSIAIYDADWNVEYHEATMSGDFKTVEVTSVLSKEPRYVLLYPRNELANARTRDLVVVNQVGNLQTPNMYWDLSVESITDSALISFEQTWSYPDPIKLWSEKPYEMSTYRYWSVSGLNLNNVEMSASFFYDGRSSGSNGYLDIDLVSESEDSLILLHRASSADDWEEYEFYEKNMLGLSNNAFGIMQLSKVKPGEYVLANRNHDVLDVKDIRSTHKELLVFPNPAKDQVRLKLEDVDTLNVSVMDVQGKLIQKKMLTFPYDLDVASLESGIYYISVILDDVRHTAKVIVD